MQRQSGGATCAFRAGLARNRGGRARADLGAHRARAALDRVAAARLGLIGGLDAWRVFSTPPLQRGGADRGGGPRSGESAGSSGAAGCATYIGALVILNVFIVGVWVASDGTVLLARLGDAGLGGGDSDQGPPASGARPRAPAGRPQLGSGSQQPDRVAELADRPLGDRVGDHDDLVGARLVRARAGPRRSDRSSR